MVMQETEVWLHYESISSGIIKGFEGVADVGWCDVNSGRQERPLGPDAGGKVYSGILPSFLFTSRESEWEPLISDDSLLGWSGLQ